MTKPLPGLSALWLMALTIALSMLLTIAVPVILSTTDIHASDWIGFAGSVVGALITLIAAAIAYVAVKDQISAGEALARRRETEVFTVLKDEMTVMLASINYIWLCVDRALEPGTSKPIAELRHSSVMMSFMFLPRRQRIDDLRTIAKDLNPISERKFIQLCFPLENFCDLAGALDKGPGPGVDRRAHERQIIAVAWNWMTMIADGLKAFDPDAAALFADRKKAPKNIPPMLDQFAGMYEMDLLREEQIVKSGAG